MNSWLDKYKPHQLDDFKCYEEEVKRIKKWMEDFKKDPHMSKKVLLLIGNTGIGKTRMCEVLLDEYGYRKIEYNSSEIRSQRKISDVLEKSLIYKNVFEMMDEENKPVGFLIDEIEGLIGTGDKGGFNEFLDLLKCNMKYEDYIENLNHKKKKSKKKNTEQKFIKIVSPLLCTSFDSNEKKLNELKKYSEVIYLQKPLKSSIFLLIDDLCKKENIEIDEESKDFLVEYMNGDIRKMIMTMEEYVNIEKNKGKKVKIEIERLKEIIKYLTEKDEDDHILNETARILYQEDLSYTTCDRIFSKECLLMPLTVYQNTLSSVKNSKLDLTSKLENYSKSLESFSIHDTVQTDMFQFIEWDELYDSACFYSMKLPNYYLTQLKASKAKLENTNLLNKISQMLVNRKLVLNTKKSIHKLNLETDNILYIIHILSYFLGDLKNNMVFDTTQMLEEQNKAILSTVNGDGEEDEEGEKREKKKVSSIEENLDYKLIEFMNLYHIDMEDLENIMKIEKLNKGLQTKKKKFTMKMKKEIESNLFS